MIFSNDKTIDDNDENKDKTIVDNDEDNDEEYFNEKNEIKDKIIDIEED
jgi:hypothetical protein